MHYIVVALFIADVMPSAGLRYRSQIGWRVIVHTAIRYPRDFSVLRDLFPHCRRPGCKGRARERTKMNERERERRGAAEWLRLIAYRPFVSKVGLARPQFLRSRFVPRRTAISWARIAALSKDLRVIIARRCQALRNDSKNLLHLTIFQRYCRGNGGQSTDECHVL